MKTLNIALLGYGKMGKEIEKIALGRQHQIIARIDTAADWEKFQETLLTADVAIDFSTPGSAVDNIKRCFERNIPIVVGTTGWDARKEEVMSLCKEKSQAIFTSSNFSIGVYLFMATARFLSQKIAPLDGEYSASIEETHHIHKLDKPSGTAITLAENVMEVLTDYREWQLKEANIPSKGVLPITSLREGETVGRHELVFDSDIDTIQLIHNAKSRQGFALGAVKAAEWIVGKKGCFQMKDMLGF